MEKGKLKHVRVDLIRDDGFRMRDAVEDNKFRELLTSVREVGVLVPILLKETKDGFLLVAGHRRYKAAQMAGLLEVPAYIFSEGTGLGWNAAFAENLYRKDLSPMEEAAAVADCLRDGKWSIEDLAKVLGRGSGWIVERVAMIDWPADISLAVHMGRISVAAVRNLVSITDIPYRSMLLDYAIDNGATARTTAAWLQSWRAGVTTEAPGDVEPVEGRSALPPIVPYTPCVVCGEKFEMAGLTYAPVCAGCSKVLMEVAREVRKTEGGLPGSVDGA